eukprot:m.380369 g.380369  ORF g.380369 m.380369 type:complete len:101 (+) comp28236_c3_seq1:164-466(+)
MRKFPGTRCPALSLVDSPCPDLKQNRSPANPAFRRLDAVLQTRDTPRVAVAIRDVQCSGKRPTSIRINTTRSTDVDIACFIVTLCHCTRVTSMHTVDHLW